MTAKKKPSVREDEIVKIPFSKLHNVFDVRRKPDTEEAVKRREMRILDFAEKMSAGIEFPPLAVTRVDRFPGGIFNEQPPEDYIIVDGRTRYQAVEIEKNADADPLLRCVVLNFKLVMDVEAYAFRQNYATAEPMTHQETADIVTKMWNAGWKEEAINKKTGIPVGQITKIISGIRESRLASGQEMRRRLAQAAEAVKSGATPDEVAKRFNVDAARLREVLAASGKVSVAGLKAGITRAARAYQGALSASCIKAFDAYHLDKIAAAELHDLMAHTEKVLADIQRKTTEIQRSSQNVLSAEKGTVFIS